MDAYWISFYEFPEKFLGIDYGVENSNKLQLWSILAKSCSWFWCYENYCFVSDRPTSYRFDNNYRLHNENGAAIIWIDGWELYYWHGVEVPPKWILNPELLSKEEVLSEKNIEKSRCLREIMGAKRYYDLLFEENGLELIDEDMDGQGFPMRLYSTKNIDPLIENKVQFLEVTCPSTERIYNIYPPSQSCKNVWEAKADTFNKEKLSYRHGDVGLLKVGERPEKPLIET
jgi:hypothetical protein